ncbi:MAG: ergothioneine biosynthesis glutamate--cysteine ligase EgtA [Actinobacteria bacterium]|nr:ergothioneine biosynthesis glutamate--cysteine ligase EgtA [Actinomycetota bacterium]
MPSAGPSLRVADVEPFIRKHCFAPAHQGLVGIELEQLAVPVDRRGAADHHAVEAATRALGTLPGRSSITFEPGGQVELSSPPRCGPAASCVVAAADLAAVGAALADVGVDLVAVGLDPRGCGPRVLDDGRYRAMESYFDAEGACGRTMMRATAALQVNVDVGASADQAARWRLAHRLGPMLVAAFANSPFADGRPHGWRSGRAAVWAGIDATRTGPVDAEGHDPAVAWSSYALAARVMLVRIGEGSFRSLPPTLPFARWIEEGHELGFPTLDDLGYHLGTLFPPVRPRGWLELRMIDSLPDPWWRAAVAVVSALLDDAGAAEAVSPSLEGTADLWADAARHGLAHPALATAARGAFAAAAQALPRLGTDPATLAAVEGFADRFVRRGRCPADDLLDAWRRSGEVLPRPQALEAAWS